MSSEDFERLVESALASLPERFQKALNNVAFLVEGHQRPARAHEHRIRRDEILLGLYEGIPLTERGAGYQWVLPDRITLFRDAIESLAGRDEKRTSELVRETVMHEIAHHFGFREPDVRQWEQKRRKRRSRR